MLVEPQCLLFQPQLLPLELVFCLNYYGEESGREKETIRHEQLKKKRYKERRDIMLILSECVTRFEHYSFFHFELSTKRKFSVEILIEWNTIDNGASFQASSYNI